MAAAPPAPTARLPWPDAARGLAVLAVVLYHALIWNQRDLSGDLPRAWGWMNVALSQLRMPVLLSLSWLLAARALGQGWRGGGAALRFASNYYLYLVWVLVYFAFYAVVPEPGLPGDIGSLAALARQLVLPDTTLWYVFVLAFFPLMIVAAGAMSIPPWLVLLAGAAMRVAGQVLEVPDAVGKPLRTFVFFAIGVYLGAVLRRFASAGLIATTAYATAFLACTVLLTRTPPGILADWIATAASIASIPATIAVVAHLCRWRVVARGGALIGSRTLPVYLLHVPLLALILMAARHLDPVGGFARSGSGVYAMPVISAVLAVAVSLAMHPLLRSVPSNALLGLPQRASDAIRARFAAHTEPRVPRPAATATEPRGSARP